MTDIERKMDHFEVHAPRCKAHREKPTITFDGCHVITCSKGCGMVDGENAAMEPLMMAWEAKNK
jgi:hypothetical protein